MLPETSFLNEDLEDCANRSSALRLRCVRCKLRQGDVSRVRGLHAIEAETRVWRRQHQSVACAWNSEEQMALLRLPAPTVRVCRRRRQALRRRWPSDFSEQALQSFAQRQVLLHSTPISEMRRCRLRQATFAIVADAYRGHASLDMPRLYSRQRTPRRSSL